MLDSLKKHITSINGDELVDLCESYLMEDKGHDIDDFVTHLFNKKMITTSEYKNIQYQEQVELTGVADIEELEKQNSQFEKLKSSPNQHVVNVIKKGQLGYYSYKDKGREKIVVYYQLDSLEWYFLIEADVEELLSDPEYLQ